MVHRPRRPNDIIGATREGVVHPWKDIHNPFMDDSEEVYTDRNYYRVNDNEDYDADGRPLYLPLRFVGLTELEPSGHVQLYMRQQYFNSLITLQQEGYTNRKREPLQ